MRTRRKESLKWIRCVRFARTDPCLFALTRATLAAPLSAPVPFSLNAVDDDADDWMVPGAIALRRLKNCECDRYAAEGDNHLRRENMLP